MSDTSNISGLVLLDKPQNITSFKACHIIKKTLQAKKTGHCGTLDPAATGLLLILIDKATSLQDKFLKQDKVYTASFLLGTSTDSADITGKIIEKKDCSHIKKADIEKALENFRGEIQQVPPMFSALHIKGKRLYELAREGIEVQRPPRKINIKKIEIISFINPFLDLIIDCSSGTYIRSIAADLGKILGCGATVNQLRRESIGAFDVKDAATSKDFLNAQALMQKIIPLKKLNEN
jgi:tRNA pseudouridine55 synthase